MAFGDLGMLIWVDARLREFDYGEFAGRPRGEVGTERTHRITEPFPGGESIMQAVERVRLFLHDIIERHEGETIVVVGHIATHYGLEHWLKGTPLAEIVASPWIYEPGWSYLVTPEAVDRIAAREEGSQ